jgi:hypothetical protein
MATLIRYALFGSELRKMQIGERFEQVHGCDFMKIRGERADMIKTMKKIENIYMTLLHFPWCLKL